MHYPGIVNSLPNALQTLGNAAELAPCLNQEAAEIHLRFRPEDPLCHPLVGTCVTNTGGANRSLVLQISRPKGTVGNDVSGTDAKAAIVSRVTASVIFGGMADFQYVSPAPRPTPDSARCEDVYDAPFGEELEEVFVVPPIFSRDDLPTDYAFRAAKGQNMPSRGLTAPRGPIMIGWSGSAQVPPQMPTFGFAETALDRRLRALLQRRPIWSPAMLERQCKEWPQASLQAAVHRACYCFKSGPWGSLLIRRGVDPRKDGEHRQWQQLAYSIPSQWWELPAGRQLLEAAREAAARGETDGGGGGGSGGAAGRASESPGKVAGSGADVRELIPRVPQPDILDVVSFQKLPHPGASKILFQVCDLGDEAIQGILSTPCQVQKCGHTTGWFTDQQILVMSQRLEANFKELWNGGTVPANPAPAAVEDYSSLPEEAAGRGEPQASFAAEAAQLVGKQARGMMELDDEEFEIFGEGDSDDGDGALAAGEDEAGGRRVAGVGYGVDSEMAQAMSLGSSDSEDEEEDDLGDGSEDDDF